MKRKKAGQHGGKRHGAGRRYNPWNRMEAADRYSELKVAHIFAGMVARNPAMADVPRVKRYLLPEVEGAFRDPAHQALLRVHAEYGGDGDPESTRKLIKRGRREADLFSLDELAFLEKLRRR